MKKLFFCLLMLFLISNFVNSEKPTSSGVVASMSDIHMDVNNIFFDKTHHFSVSVFDATPSPIQNEPCVFWTEFKATGNVLETYEMKKNCIIGLEDCYYTTNQDGNLFGQLDITDEYYDIGREYTLKVSCDSVVSSIDFNVLTWKTEETTINWGIYTFDNLYNIFYIFFILLFVVIGLVFTAKFVLFFAKS